MSVSWMHVVRRPCAAAVIDRVIRRCGVVTWSAHGLGGYCRFVGVGVWWWRCRVDRGGCVVGVDLRCICI